MAIFFPKNNPKRQFTPNICCKIKNMDPNLANKAGLPAMDGQIRILEDDHNHSFKNHHFTSQSEVVELGKHNLITFTGMYHLHHLTKPVYVTVPEPGSDWRVFTVLVSSCQDPSHRSKKGRCWLVLVSWGRTLSDF